MGATPDGLWDAACGWIAGQDDPRPIVAIASPSGAAAVATPTATLRLTLDRASKPVWAWLDPRTGRGLEPPIGLAGEPAAVLGRVLSAFADASAPRLGQGGGGFVGVLAHEAAVLFEPAVRSRKKPPVPLLELHRVEACAAPRCPAPERSDAALLRMRSQTGRLGYLARVRMVQDYIRSGDVYQANLGHRLTTMYSGSARELFARLAMHNQPAHGAYVEYAPGAGARAIASMSPELFLRVEGSTRRVRTRPMKGTRPSGLEDDLRRSAKDRAELSMIVDLMRNDLGRVCEFGSVVVDEPRRIERHHAGAVAQATADVAGVLRDGVGLAELLAATFPPGSVTGAPKVRALQLIDELEDFPRGAWCGSVLALGDDGSAECSVAIRTATITAARLDYPVGAGIVADSDPVAEWRETLAKAEALRSIAQIEDEP